MEHSRAIVVRSTGRDAGQGLVEYGLILVLAAIVALVALLFFGGTLGAVLSVIVSWVGTSS